jgi:hypothetical protein
MKFEANAIAGSTDHAPPIRQHWNPRHRFATSGNQEFRRAGCDFARGHIDAFEPGAAEGVELHASGLLRVACRDRGYARQALTLFSEGPDDPEDDVVYVTGVELIAVAQTFQNSLCKMNAGGFVQRPIGLPASARSGARGRKYMRRSTGSPVAAF